MSKSVLVTGVAGFIGSHIAERLLAEDRHVIGLDSFTEYYSRSDKEANLSGLYNSANFRFVEGDLCTLDLHDLLAKENIGYIFHEAGQAGVRPSWGMNFDSYVTRNIIATQRLLEACANADVDRFVFASSSSVYGNAEKLPTDELVLPRPVSPYGVTKLAAEHLCMLYAKQFQLPVVALRYFSVYGPRQRPDGVFRIFINALLHQNPVQILGDGEQTRDFTYISDVVDANLLALITPYRGAVVYNVGGGSRVKLNATLRLLGSIMGVRPRVEYSPRAAGDHRDGAADISRAQRDLNYRPCVNLEEGLQRQLAWQKSSQSIL